MVTHGSTDNAHALIARADKYLNAGSGEYASEIMRDMADYIRASLTTASGEAAEARDGQMQLAMSEIERLEALNLALSSTDEMENYRLALAWIKEQSTDPQAKEIAATALFVPVDTQNKALAASWDVREWQPIETAPRDGRLAIVYRPLALNSGDHPVALKRLIKGNHHCWDNTVPKGDKPMNPTDGSCHVTHWMAIPEPPGSRNVPGPQV